MKVIAINNAPDIDTTPSWAKKFNLNRAYTKFDIFNTKNENFFKNIPVIFHPVINDFMEVTPENFQPLDQFRESIINQFIH